MLLSLLAIKVSQNLWTPQGQVLLEKYVYRHSEIYQVLCGMQKIKLHLKEARYSFILPKQEFQTVRIDEIGLFLKGSNGCKFLIIAINSSLDGSSYTCPLSVY